MPRIASFLLTASLVATPAIPQTSVEPDRAPPGYTKVFADEFNGTTIDTAKWAYDTHRNAQGWYNQEKQYYAAGRMENARVENGHLVIEARSEKLDKARFPDFGGQRYTSTRLFTKGRASWTYGFYEIRAKIPCGRGTWPAIWMLPEDPDVKWPDGGEIDIMEHVGFDPTVIHQTLITRAFNYDSGVQQTKSFKVADACTAFHRYQLLWTDKFIVMGVDDEPRFMLKNVRNDRDRWPFDKPMHLLLNIAVGGTWGGQKGVDPNVFPARMEVDYVRVYQLNPGKKK
ncbi:MAG: glycoside hydrolase family 16 protein [Sphingomicrobium sp.]